MKKFVTLSLAALMALSLGVTAFAAANATATLVNTELAATSPAGFDALGTAYYSPRDLNENDDDVMVALAGDLHPGMTLYFPLMTKAILGPPAVPAAPMTVSDAVKSIKISVKNQTGADYVESFRVEYKKFDATGEYGYVLAIKTKDRADTGIKHYGAEVTLSKSSGNDGATPAKTYTFKATYNVNFSINYFRNKTDIFRYPVVLNYGNSIVTPDSVETIEFVEAEGVYFEVDLFQQGNIIAAFNARYNPEIAAKFPEANLDFYNGNGVTFAKIGELTIPAEEGSFLYVQDAEGNLTKVDATYDSAEESFKVNTRVLGKYVVSDVELDLTVAPEVPAEPVETVEPKPNVDTGAAA